jgi:hypothetical protein
MPSNKKYGSYFDERALRQELLCRSLTFLLLLSGLLSVAGWIAPMTRSRHRHSFHAQPSRLYERVSTDTTPPSPGENYSSDDAVVENNETEQQCRRVVIVGAGWGGLSAAHALAKDSQSDPSVQVTVLDASPRVGGLVRDGFTTISGARPAEAGQHGFWRNYRLTEEGNYALYRGGPRTKGKTKKKLLPRSPV